MSTLKTTVVINENIRFFRIRNRYVKSILLIVALMISAISATQAANEDFKLLASDGAISNYFGNSVSASDGRIAIGAHGISNSSAYIYDWDGSQWNETKLTASDGAYEDFFGYSIAVSGDRIVAGAHGDDDNYDNSGSVYIFDWDGTQWNETKITASDGAAWDRFGNSVSVSGDRIVVGSHYDDDNGSQSGSAYIYDWDGTQWNETKITASDGAATDYFGTSVSVSENRIVVSSYYDDDNGSESGSAYVYDWDGAQWNETKITASDGTASDNFGRSVSVSGDRIVVGANHDDDNGNSSGSAYIYDWDGSQWNETKLTAFDGVAADYFGQSVSVFNDLIVVGAYGDDNNTGSIGGSAYMYFWDGTQWNTTKLTPSDALGNKHFGYSVSVFNDLVVVGAFGDNYNGALSGSAYTHTYPLPPPPPVPQPEWISANGTDIYLQNGGVAIGTDTIPASYKLAVDGKIIAEEVTVELSANWPDYVFEPDYKLPSLQAVETHIANHKHLPNIPSSRELEHAGLSMSDMFVKQMQKIEELTLYMIEMNKKSHVLTQRIEVLEER